MIKKNEERDYKKVMLIVLGSRMSLLRYKFL